MNTGRFTFRSAASVFILACGAEAVYAAIIILVFGATLSSFFTNFDSNIAIVPLSDGRTVVQTHISDNSPLTPSYSYATLAGEKTDMHDAGDPSKRAGVLPEAGDFSGPLRIIHSNRSRSCEFTYIFLPGEVAKREVWFFALEPLPEARSYLIGFSRESKRVIGYIGKNGFSTEKPSPSNYFSCGQYDIYQQRWRMPNDHSERLLLFGKSGVVQIDLAARKAESILEKQGVISISSVWLNTPSDPNDLGKLEFGVGARTEKQLLLIFNKDKSQKTLEIPEEFRKSDLAFYVLRDSEYLLTAKTDSRNQVPRAAWYDADGKFIRSRSVKIAEPEKNNLADRVLLPVVMPSPIFIATQLYYGVSDNANSSVTFDDSKASFAWEFAAIFAVSLVSGGACYRRQKKLRGPHALAWGGLVFLLGLPGYFGYRLYVRRPPFETCPICGKTTPRDRERCACCGAEFPPPEMNGAEILSQNASEIIATSPRTQQAAFPKTRETAVATPSANAFSGVAKKDSAKKTSAFVAMLRKELRETRWIVCAAVVIYALLILSFTGDLGELSDGAAGHVPFLEYDGGFPAITAIAFAAILGLWQSTSESRRRNWLFLLHRPATRRNIIAAKLLVGAAIYFLITSAAMLAYVYLATRPSRYGGPFSWQMSREYWEGLTALSLVYFGAFLSGIRPARWYGSRLFPLVAGILYAGFGSQIAQGLNIDSSSTAVVALTAVGSAVYVICILQVVRSRDYS